MWSLLVVLCVERGLVENGLGLQVVFLNCVLCVTQEPSYILLKLFLLISFHKR